MRSIVTLTSPLSWFDCAADPLPSKVLPPLAPTSVGLKRRLVRVLPRFVLESAVSRLLGVG